MTAWSDVAFNIVHFTMYCVYLSKPISVIIIAYK